MATEYASAGNGLPRVSTGYICHNLTGIYDSGNPTQPVAVPGTMDQSVGQAKGLCGESVP